ncbi:MAG: DUF4372 domain-containing protein [Treponema sp.]|nr:DUF4372 domain-containing protein [Treponema sp.]
MTKYTTVLASLLSSLNRSNFDRAVQRHRADKGIRSLSILACFKQIWCTDRLQAVSAFGK